LDIVALEQENQTYLAAINIGNPQKILYRCLSVAEK